MSPGNNPWFTDWHALFHSNKEISKKHTFQVWLKDSTSLLIEGKIDFDSASYCLSWTDKTLKRNDSGRIKKLHPRETLGMAVVDDFGTITLRGKVRKAIKQFNK